MQDIASQLHPIDYFDTVGEAGHAWEVVRTSHGDGFFWGVAMLSLVLMFDDVCIDPPLFASHRL